jgi:hypothetical protein
VDAFREPAQREKQAAEVAARPAAAPSLPAVARVLALQQSAGNAAVSRMLPRESAAVADAEKTKRPADKRPKATGTSTAAQKKGSAPNAYGEFTWDITKAAGNNGCDVQISFKAFSPEVDATKITIIQAVKSTKGGATHYPNNNKAYYQPLESPTGLRTDATTTETDPFYNYDDKAQADETTGTTGATKTDMTDAPSLNLIPGKDASQVFETAAFALSGKDEGEFFGTVKWGWDIDATGKYTLHEPVVSDDITTDFGVALRKFIGRKHDSTKTGTTPAPAELEMPLDRCRDLTAAENTKLKTFADYVKKTANARMWVVARYSGKTGSDPEHRMAIDNARTVQNGLKTLGATDAAVHITALEDSSAKERVSPIEVTVIDT